MSDLQEQVALCCGTVADKEKMQQLLAELTDQRDAAVLAAKTLGDEVQKLREDLRMFRMNVAELRGVISSLEAGVEDIDLSLLSGQLDQIGRMCDEHGNGVDAKLAFDAARVVAMVECTLGKFADE